MALVKKPVKGMKDVMPKEMEIRAYVQNLIRETYEGYGFTQIETPCVESIENLCSKQGGENEKLIFKIMKRGDKLRLSEAQSEADLTDTGLRYDLTLPLSRYYACHSSELPTPFKALQMGNVWRADQPQKGRFRQFMQCDIDILGDPSNLAEIELILAMSTVLGKLNFKDFNIRYNDRRMLKAMASYAGFAEEDYDSVFITLDKMDKIGTEGVKECLVADGYEASKVEKYLALFDGLSNAEDGVAYLKATLGDFLPAECYTNLTEIADSVNGAKTTDFTLLFDPTLVRGMSYYTGTIFEVELKEFGSSCGGGGRYDKMIGRFTGQDTPAVGFSIGFERIITILLDNGFTVPGSQDKVALLLDKGLAGEKLSAAMKEAESLRKEGKKVLVVRMNKNKKFQKQQLEESGYKEFKEYYAEALKN